MSDLSFDLEDIILSLKREHGKLTRSQKWESEYWQVAIKNRYAFMVALVSAIKEAGKSKGYFAPTTCDKIIEHLIPAEKSVKSAQAYAFWKKCTRDHLKMAVIEVYSAPIKPKVEEEIPVKEEPFKEFDRSIIQKENVPEDVVDPEMAALLGYDDE